MSLKATWGQAELGALTATAMPSVPTLAPGPLEAPFLECATMCLRGKLAREALGRDKQSGLHRTWQVWDG